jgi:uncharacterized protein YjdB
MKGISKLFISLFLVFSTVFTVVPETVPIVNVEAASVKLNKTSVSLKKGKTVTLKVLNTKKTVKWSSSKKSVATVNSKGKVTAKGKGTAYIYAKINNKTLKCKIKVTVSQSSSTNSTKVYITATGSKYHRKAKCGNTKTSWQVTLSEAKSEGYTPCKKCY